MVLSKKPVYKSRKPISPISWTTDTWLDKTDVLELLHISSRTLQNWRSNNIITYSRLGGKIYYKEKDLQTLLEANVKQTNKLGM